MAKKREQTTTLEKPEEEPKGELLAITSRDVVDIVTDRVEQLIGEGALAMPDNYSPQNALMAAWLTLQETEDKDGNLALTVCSKNSIANALLDMVIQGLTPAKNQCYFIVYGKQLVCQRSYFGTVGILKRIYPGAREYTQIVYEGDEFEYEFDNGRKRITLHSQRLEHIDDEKIVAGYCVVEPGEGHEPLTIILNRDQIQAAWEMGNANGKSPAHKNFQSEMAKKTLINNACKILINSSDDSYLKTAVHRQEVLTADAAIEAEIDEKGNLGKITMDFGDEGELEETGAEVLEPVEGEISDEEEAAILAAEKLEQEDQDKSQPGF